MYLKRMANIPEHLLKYNISKNGVRNSQYNKRIDSKILECLLLYYMYNVSQEYGVQNFRTVAILQCISSEWFPKFQNIYYGTTMSLKRIMSKIPEHLLLYYNVSQEYGVQNSRTVAILQYLSRE